MEPVQFAGHSGRIYSYEITPIPLPAGRGWHPCGGNYCFARVSDGVVIPIYFGECKSFATRGMPPAHEKWKPARRYYGVTHLLTHIALGPEVIRKAEEQDLIAAYNPPMNVQHRTAPAGQRGIGLRRGHSRASGLSAASIGTPLPT